MIEYRAANYSTFLKSLDLNHLRVILFDHTGISSSLFNFLLGHILLKVDQIFHKLERFVLV
jgi:hypothetical protein